VRHNPAFFAPARSAIPTVVTIHDLAVLRTPERFRPWFRNYAARALPHTVRVADRIVTGSEASREDIVERLGADAARVVVTPYGVAPHLTPLSADDPQSRAVRARYALPPRYILAVGSIEPRKNLPALLDALRIMRTLPGCEDAQLVHAGPLGWLAEDVPRSLATRGLAGAARFLGYVSESDLHALYAQARMVAYPSLFEGFGFPVLEAMACGAPVVTSNVSSLPEVAGAAALLVDPMQPDAIADAMAQLWQNETLHAELRARGLARAAAFTWRRTAEATDAVYRSLA
jgi:glycosyltransferase involved in cell wall biosynthesis